MYRFMIVLMLVASMVMADEIFLNRNVQETQIKLVQDNLQAREAASLVFQAQVASVTTENVETPAGVFTHLYLPGWQYTNNPGEPQLPVMNKIIEVPMGGALSVRLVSANKLEGMTRDYNIQNALYPCQPSYRKDQKETPFVYSRDAYQTAPKANPVVSVEEIGIMRNARLAMISFMPVEYSPVDGKVAFYTDMTAEVVVENVNWQATQELKQGSNSAFAFMSKHVITPASLVAQPERATTYLIVAGQIFDGSASLNAFIAHKKAKGYNVVVKYLAAGSTVDAVLAVIKAEYAASKPTFLLIVGDNEQIPGKSVGQYTDLYYSSTMVGGDSDYLPDMLCGRFSATNEADLAAQVNKTIAYENKQFTDSGAFLKKYALVAGWDYSWSVKRGYPQIRYAYKYWFNEAHGLEKPILDVVAGRNVFLSAKSQDATSNIVSLISTGVGFFNYTAHGSQTDFSDPNFTQANIDALTNTNKYPLVVGNCCLTSSFQVSTCFGEKWLRAKDKGAIGYIGGSNYTYWDEDLWFGNGYYVFDTNTTNGNAPEKSVTGAGMYDTGFGEYDANLPIKLTNNASVMVAGNLAVQNSTSTRKLYYWQVYHLFGDPSLPCYWNGK